jgi:hypothetical protein
VDGAPRLQKNNQLSEIETQQDHSERKMDPIVKTRPQGVVSRNEAPSAKPNPTYARPQAEEYGGAEHRR